MTDDDFHAWRAEEQVKREAGGDLLAYIRARAEAEETRTRQLLDALTAGIEAEEPEDHDDLKEAA